jgi:hypothetical protein
MDSFCHLANSNVVQLRENIVELWGVVAMQLVSKEHG